MATLTSDNLLDTSGLHSGKWTFEEQLYVQELIKEFKSGTLAIEEGLSLRRFLSKALNCSPKRISKKFEGTLYNGTYSAKKESKS
jgi:cell division protein YceG involved in septum cleavage